MNASADERLIVMLEARIKDFERNMAKAEGRGTRTYQRLKRDSSAATAKMESDMVRSTSRINQALSSVSTQIGTFGKGLAGGLLAGFGAMATAGLTGQLRATVQGIAQVGDEAKRAGLSARAFQEWRYVAEQNRIGIDAMVDGFKELNLRADEFIVTGAGPAAEAFNRLGFTAADLTERLKDPSALMLEIVNRLGRLDRAAQIRISDEIFGGSAGERFVELLDQGEQGLRRTIDRAHEVGRVMDEAMIQKAQELDRKWQDLVARVETFGKTVAVALADIPLDAIEVRLSEIFDEAGAQMTLGPELFEAFSKLGGLTEEQALALSELRGEYFELEEAARLASVQMAAAAGQADSLGMDDLWQVLAQGSESLRALADQFAEGEITAEDFRAKIAEVQRDTRAAFDAMGAADQVNFGTAISEVDRLGAVIEGVASRAAGLLGLLREMAGIQGGGLVSSGRGSGQSEADRRRRDDNGNGTDLAPGSSPRPRSAPLDIDFGYSGSGTGSTGSAGGGGGDDFAGLMEETRERIELLHQETAAFLEAAQSGRDYGDMAEYARKRAELLFAAQREGKEITPELAAEIDALAASYATAGMQAEEAAARMEKIQENSRRGADAIAGIFTAALSGADAAKKAIADLLVKLIEVQMQKALLGLSGGSQGGFLGFLGGLLSFDGGGHTGRGSRSGGLDGKGGFLAMLHPNETVIDHTKGGGKSSAGAGQTVAVNVKVSVDQNGNLQAFVDQRAASVAAPMIKISERNTVARLPGAIKNAQRRRQL